MPTPFQPIVVDGPPATPPVYGLLVAADVIPENGDRWYVGAHWRPEQIGGGGVAHLGCAGDSETLSTGTNGHLQQAEPFVVWAEDHCTTLTGSKAWAEYEARARRQLEAVQSFQIAREFQLGALRDANTLVNPALKDATVIHPGALDPIPAIAELESALAETFKGRRGMIHVTPQVLVLLDQSGMLTRAGQKWLTAAGTIVVADAGYKAESDAFLYAYATSMVQVRLSAIDVPATFGDGLGTFAYTLNDVVLYAQREAMVQLDSTISATPGTGTADAMFKIQLTTKPFALHS